MAECSGEVVYQNQASRFADCAAFDDRALIHSYDHAVHSFKESLGNGRNPPECSSNDESESDVEEEEEEEEEGRQWRIRDACLAVWSVDGLLYPACITAVDQDRGCCTVCFDGYGNEEEQPLAALLPPGWRPPEDEDAAREPLQPPLQGRSDEESLLSMLLAWHLSGYHTGYYLGLRQGRKEAAVPAVKKIPPQHPRVSEHC